jgi:hypothetical protein
MNTYLYKNAQNNSCALIFLKDQNFLNYENADFKHPLALHCFHSSNIFILPLQYIDKTANIN